MSADYGVVADCARMRQDAQDRPLTIPQAIELAQSYRAQPEILVDSFTSKRVMDALLSALEASPCYLKAVQEGQDVFVLRQHDRAAPGAIEEWALMAERHGASKEKVDSARAKIQHWEEQSLDDTRWPT